MSWMHRCRLCVATGVAAASCAWAVGPRADAQVILDEQFDGDAVDTSVFTFSGPGDESFFGRTQLNSPGLPGPFDTPTVADGVLRLELNTFNPFSPGRFFLAEEIRTIQQFAPTLERGLSFETRARFVDDEDNPLAPGLIGGIFLFGLDPFAFPLVRDEVDFELLSNFPQDTILTNIFNDDGFTSSGNVQSFNVPGLDLTEFNDFRIESTLTATRFFVNDELVRIDTTDLAVEPQDFRLNINAQGPEFALAFSADIQPTADPTQNQTFIFEVDSLVISAFDTGLTLGDGPLTLVDLTDSNPPIKSSARSTRECRRPMVLRSRPRPIRTTLVPCSWTKAWSSPGCR
ncbi:MAG: glycoside hydrolase family 16 protein [Planctomycetota bacterium]